MDLPADLAEEMNGKTPPLGPVLIDPAAASQIYSSGKILTE